MSKHNLKIVRSFDPKRCEICHQNDMFDAQSNYCERCQGQKPSASVSLLKDDDQSAKEKNDILIARFNPKKPSFTGNFRKAWNQNRSLYFEFSKKDFKVRARRSITRYLKIPEQALESMDSERLKDLFDRIPESSSRYALSSMVSGCKAIVFTPIGYISCLISFFEGFFREDAEACAKASAAILSPWQIFLLMYYWSYDPWRIKQIYKKMRDAGFTDEQLFE